MTQVIGFAAAILTTIAMLPQAVKAWKTKDTRSLSLPMLVILCVGLGLWATYGIMLGELPIIIANGASILLVGSILVMKLRFG